MELLILKDNKFNLTQAKEIEFIGENDAFIRFRPLRKAMEMVQIYVRDDKRLKGCGTKIIKRFEKIIKERNLSIMVIKTATDKTQGFCKFIIKMGYWQFKPDTWIKEL